MVQPHPSAKNAERVGHPATHRRLIDGGQVMKDATQRSIVRWMHIVFAIPILGYIYSPFDKIPQYAPATRFVFVPVLVVSGLWMWKGHVVRRFISKRSAGGTGSVAGYAERQLN
jgi:hypothetical protein